MTYIEDIFFDFEKEAVGVITLPYISWTIVSDKKNVIQKEFQLQIAQEEKFENIIFQTGIIESTNNGYSNTNIKLEDFTSYFIKIQITDNYNENTNFKTSKFSTGFVNTSFTSKMITVETDQDIPLSKGTYLEKNFLINKKVKEAYIASTSFGLYQIYIDKQKIGKKQLTPGWTSYNKHLIYQVYDITKMLKKGTHILGVMLGAGWYKGDMFQIRHHNIYGNKTAFLGEIHIKFTDGSIKIIKSDESFQGTYSPIVFANIYDGEIYDESKEINNLNLKKCSVIPYKIDTLELQKSGSVEIIEEIKPKTIFKTPEGDTVIDFGQNFSGWIKIKAKGNVGDKIELNCFEVLDKESNVYTENLLTAKQTTIYKFAKNHSIEYIPHFTFFGFRYAKIAHFPKNPTIENFTGYVLHTKMEHTGEIITSNKMLNKLNHNILWGLKSNFVDIPTDCPQRDERLGWTGDAQIFAPSANFLMNSFQFYSKWLKDLLLDQTKEGGVPHIVPDILTQNSNEHSLLKKGTDSAAAWADAAVIIPWILYKTYGTKNILIQQYSSMKNWIDFMKNHSKDYIWSYKLQFGDWVALDGEKGSHFGATPTNLICAAYCAYSTEIFIKTAKILNKIDDVEKYTELYKNVVEKYQKTFLTSDGHLIAQTQTANIISLYFQLVPNEYKQKITDDLISLLKKENNHLVTGFIGTPYFCHALSENGKIDEAYDLLLKDDFPSWLYQVKMGATTIWEHWNGIKEDGTFYDPKMNSFNHYAYGAIEEWMVRVMVGLESDENNPGYKHFFIQPLVTDKIKWVKAKYKSVNGLIESKWKNTNNKTYKLTVHIPANTTCTIKLKQAKEIIKKDNLNFAKNGEYYKTTVGSGIYNIIFCI